eukprot:TRINITY_DN19749_c0_g1_i1.p1 TRINITY_DN19749_c0_g1~~TRINITY_DN19749_c0_g1_i1.p1  ORF type:complete len:334 (+),score=136.65 TRINITY_DN19749_c0_g1_i1:64-1002(+)
MDVDDGQEQKQKLGFRARMRERLEALDLTPAQRLRLVAGAIEIISALQIIVALAMFLTGWYESTNEREKFESLFSGTVGFVSPLVAFFGILGGKPSVVRLYFVMQMWVLAIVTSFMYETIASGRVQEHVCSPSLKNYGEIAASCEQGLATSRGKIVMAVMASLFSVSSALLSLEYTDVHSEIEADKPDGGLDSRAKRARARNLALGGETDGAAVPKKTLARQKPTPPAPPPMPEHVSFEHGEFMEPGTEVEHVNGVSHDLADDDLHEMSAAEGTDNDRPTTPTTPTTPNAVAAEAAPPPPPEPEDSGLDLTA